ncbi:peroxide stress protein YaaA [Levilactobacillus enshiensis]|uniref:peroxide stress protein YaaA n=1 Tax=Levilactobacillus enshiensis TaxID=2590213 RepID=UPI00117B916F|nr:peroxide stress protein YaaA [Levilactobacillus enshiensis]
MKIIIAPAKKMVVDTDTFGYDATPQYLPQTQQILAELRRLTYPQAKALWHCSDKLAQPNYDWLQQLDLTRQLTPALLAFSGIQYQYMAPDLFTAPALDYVRANLRILSGFYGILRPFDGIVPYRLEMQAKLQVAGAPNLYAFWQDRLYQALTPDAEPIVNLASQEYTKTIQPYLRPQQPFVTVVFASLVAGKLKVKATLAKMARGEMVRFLAEHQATTIAAIKNFDHPDWAFSPEQSTTNELVFIYQK